jgi:transcriptional regulator with XRE-family HTH domain
MTATIGSRLLKARLKKNLTQAQLARESGLSSEQLISRYERGVSTPRAGIIVELARALGVSAGWLLSGPSGSRREP